MTTSNTQSVRNIIIFTLLVNGLAWLGPVLGGTPAEPGLGFLVWGIAPITAALIMKFILRDKISLGFKPALQGNGRWYILSIFIYPLAIAAVLGLGLLLGVTRLNQFTGTTLLSTMLPLAVTFFIFALFEEVGWRGYLAPKMYALHDGLLGHALVGVIWASWHFPYMRELWAHTSEGLVTLLPRFILGTIVATVVYGEIRLRSGSLWPAVLMHGIGNTVANSLLTGFVTFVPGWAWLGSFGVEGVLMMVLFALWGTWLYLDRRRKYKELVQKPAL